MLMARNLARTLAVEVSRAGGEGGACSSCSGSERVLRERKERQKLGKSQHFGRSNGSAWIQEVDHGHMTSKPT